MVLHCSRYTICNILKTVGYLYIGLLVKVVIRLGDLIQIPISSDVVSFE